MQNSFAQFSMGTPITGAMHCLGKAAASYGPDLERRKRRCQFCDISHVALGKGLQNMNLSVTRA
ncbi:protein of unknown function [Ectopseudomonas oleovorans]|nr:protein of unknown function [Pseudomonas oleovorans]